MSHATKPLLPRVLSSAETAKTLNCSLATLRRLVRAGEMPMPVQLSRRAIGFREDELREWLDARPRGLLAQPQQFNPLV